MPQAASTKRFSALFVLRMGCDTKRKAPARAPRWRSRLVCRSEVNGRPVENRLVLAFGKVTIKALTFQLPAQARSIQMLPACPGALGGSR